MFSAGGSVSAAFSDAIKDILLLARQKKMFRIAANLVVAPMGDDFFTWVDSRFDEKCDSMGNIISVVYIHAPIAAETRSGPLPANIIGTYLDMAPKPCRLPFRKNGNFKSSIWPHVHFLCVLPAGSQVPAKMALASSSRRNNGDEPR